MPRVSLALLLVAILAACDSTPDEPSGLDAQLEETLDEFGGMDAFVLPDAADLAAVPQDPRNPLTTEKVALGQLLFHETALAVNAEKTEGMGTYACSSCHHPAAGFGAGVPQGLGEGGSGFGRFGEARTMHTAYTRDEVDRQPIRPPTILNTAWQDVTLWNGQFGATGTNAGTEYAWAEDTPLETNVLGYEGQETQAIAGLTVHRMGGGPAHVYATIPRYQELFDAAFPSTPASERATTVTAGLAIAAYVRTVIANRSPFQRWLRGDRSAMTTAQKRGALVFFGKAQCATCHSGPSLASTTFHALGMGELEGPGVFSDFNPKDPVHLGRASFTERDEDRYKFKTPQLYNLSDDPHFGHGSTFRTIREVVQYKNAAVSQSPYVPDSRLAPEFVPLRLTPDEVDDLVMFLEMALYDPELTRYVPTSVPSGNCFPSNDAQSRVDLGCEGPLARPVSLLGFGSR